MIKVLTEETEAWSGGRPCTLIRVPYSTNVHLALGAANVVESLFQVMGHAAVPLLASIMQRNYSSNSTPRTNTAWFKVSDEARTAPERPVVLYSSSAP